MATKTGMQVQDLAKDNPQMSDWLLYGLRGAGYRKMIVVVDVEKRSVRMLTWPSDQKKALDDLFVRGVVTNGPITGEDDQGE